MKTFQKIWWTCLFFCICNVSYGQLYINYEFNTFYRTTSKIQDYIKKTKGVKIGIGYTFKNYYIGLTGSRHEYTTDLWKVVAIFPNASILISILKMWLIL